MIDDYRYDCEHIRDVLRQHEIEVTLEQAYDLWEDHSEMVCAGWLQLPEDDNALWLEIGASAQEMKNKVHMERPACIYCEECRRWMPLDANYCPWCGVKV